VTDNCRQLQRHLAAAAGVLNNNYYFMKLFLSLVNVYDAGSEIAQGAVWLFAKGAN